MNQDLSEEKKELEQKLAGIKEYLDVGMKKRDSDMEIRLKKLEEARDAENTLDEKLKELNNWHAVKKMNTIVETHEQ